MRDCFWIWKTFLQLIRWLSNSFLIVLQVSRLTPKGISNKVCAKKKLTGFQNFLFHPKIRRFDSDQKTSSRLRTVSSRLKVKVFKSLNKKIKVAGNLYDCIWKKRNLLFLETEDQSHFLYISFNISNLIVIDFIDPVIT